MYNFTFDDVVSTDYGVSISGPGVHNAPVKQYEMIEIPGRSGDLAIYSGRLQNLELTYPAFITENMKANIQGFRNALLSKTGYMRLTDTYNPDEYRLAVYQGGLDVDLTQLHREGSFDIVFNCKPQRYLVSGDTEQIFTENGYLVNPTRFPAAPLIAVTGAGEVGIGDYTITVDAPASRVTYIDCDIMDAWYMYGGKTPANETVEYSGDRVPVLQPGQSWISLGGASRVKITPRWWRV